MQNTKVKRFLKQPQRKDIFPIKEIQLDTLQTFQQQQQKPKVNKITYPKQ